MTTIAFDTETKGLDWWKPEEQAFLATWADEHGEHWADLSDPESAEVRRFLDAIKSADALVAHNFSFDAHQIRETLGFDIIAWAQEHDVELHDTDLESRVLLPEGQRKGERGGHGLKNLSTVYLRVDAKDPEEAIKEMGKSIGLRTMKQAGAYFDVYRAYPNEMVTYAVADARYTRDLKDVFDKKCAEEPAQCRVYQMERKVMPILIEAERIGIATDQKQVHRFKKEFTAARDEVRERVVMELGEKSLTPRKDWDESWDDDESENLAEALQKVGVPLHERTKTGKLSTARAVLGEFEADFPVISDLFEFRRLQRFLNTYIGPTDGVEVIHPSFSQVGAWTGRMSCRRPNMQNWPQRAGKEVRSVLVPRPGHAFVVVDYATIEVRLLAYYLGDPGFRQLIRDGHDTHSWMAAQIWGGTIEDWRKDGPLAEGEQSRKTARHTLFAVMYGAGARRISRQLGISQDEAKSLVSKVKSSLPNYYHLTKHRIEPKIKSVGYVNTIAGRKNPVQKDKAYVGLNALIQGSAADIMKLGLINVAEAIKPYGASVLLVVHDEVVVETPLGTEHEVKAAVEEAMVSAWNLDPPLGVEGHIAYNNYAEA